MPQKWPGPDRWPRSRFPTAKATPASGSSLSFEKYPDLIDSLNPADSLRTRKLTGTTTIYDLQFNSDKQCWENGAVYNPSNGKTYHCTCRLAGDGKYLDFRGYLGISALGHAAVDVGGGTLIGRPYHGELSHRRYPDSFPDVQSR